MGTCIAYFYIEEENEECGSKYLRFALKQGESFAETYYGYGQYLFKQKQYKKACEIYQQAYIYKKNPIYKYCEAICFLEKKQLPLGIQVLEKLFKSHLPKELYIQVRLNYSYALFQNNEVEKSKRIVYELYESQNREAFETENLYQLAQLHSFYKTMKNM